MAVRKRSWKKPNGETGEAWVVDYKSSGKRHIKTFPTRKEAVAFRDTTGVEVREGRHVADSVSITVADAAAIWLKACELGRGDNPPAEFSTLRTYRSNLKHHILPAIGKVKLAHLTRANVAAFRDHLLTKLSRVMAKKVLASFKGIMAEAEARGHVVGNVASSVRIGNKGRHKEPVAIPTKAEVKSIMAKLDELATDKRWRRWRVLFATAIHSGFRASELRGLHWDTVDLKAGTITVKQRADERGVIGSPKTVASRRTISIPAFLVTMLRDWKIECPPGPLVFPTTLGTVQLLSDIHTKGWRPLQVAAKITKADGSARLNFHCLRHFRASMLIEDGANPKEVMVEMGHSNIAMTYDLYGHLFTDEDADTRRAERAERLASKLRG
ncbi:MAG: tyrosine-type recombinase/integrase [Methyloceanibacter sp.]